MTKNTILNPTQINVNNVDELKSTDLNKALFNKSGRSNGKPPIRKRHWFAGSVMILVGSWITHTTTATIATPSTAQPLGLLAAPLDNNDTVIVTQNLLASNIRLDDTTPNDKLHTETVNTVEVENDAIEIVEQFNDVRHKIKKGESLGVIFRNKGYDLSLPYKLSKHPIAKNLVSLSVGKELTFKLDDNDTVRGIVYPTSALEELQVEIKDKEIINAEIKTLDYVITEHTVSAEINSSLFLSAQKAGLSHNLIMEMVRIFGWDVDFVLDIRAGDSYHIVYSRYEKDGKKLSDGNILAAEFTTQGQTYRAIRFVDEHENVSYYTPEGKSMLGTFLRSPVKFSRISSRFGKRKHPISKKWKAHKGTDYAASRGTPIRATADGEITSAGRKGGYGKTVVIRHAGRFSTLYAHMNGFAKGIRSGSRIKQGDIIGYVGTTGYSTGPHLHYEFRVDGVHRNSLTYKTPKASSISEESKVEFNLLAKELSAQLDRIEKDYLIAQAKADKKTTL